VEKTISIIGCGWLGFPLAKEFIGKGYKVKGSTTRVEKLKVLSSAGIEPFILRLPVVDGLENNLLNSKTIIFNIPPRLRNRTESEYLKDISSFLELLSKVDFAKLIHISTTSIYGDRKGICTENDEDRASIHFKAENLLKVFCAKNNKLFVSARCGGLMGYDRFPCKYYNESNVLSNGHIGVNYIHRDDLINILVQVVETDSCQGVFNIVAPIHPSRKELIVDCAKVAGINPPQFINSEEKGKEISVDFLKKELKYEFKYPNPLGFYYVL
jgi:nucleoside-diphosphate-sugar epimerase